MNSTTRRHFLRTCSAAAGAGLLQACGTGTTTTPQTKTTSTTAKPKPCNLSNPIRHVPATTSCALLRRQASPKTPTA